MTHQSFLRCKLLEMCHLYSGLDCAKSLVFSITATLDWSRITWPPRASWLRQGALKFIIVASRFVDGSDKRDRSKFNFEDIFLTTLWAALVPFVIITSLGVGWEFWGVTWFTWGREGEQSLLPEYKGRRIENWLPFNCRWRRS